MLLVVAVVATLACFTRHPLTVSLMLLGLVAGLVVEAGTHDKGLAAMVVVLVLLATLVVRALLDLAGSLRPRRELRSRTAAEREADERARRRRLAA